ncbi:MAG: serine hydrolase domain-containing protein, partial [Myxococcota bacterium]
GGAFTLAESIVEETYRAKFDEFMRTKLLGPVGMRQSTFGTIPPSWRRNFAYGHEQNKRLPYRVCVGKAAGGLTTTARDYAQFLLTLINGGVAPNRRQVLKPSSFMRMMTPGHRQGSTLASCGQGRGCSKSGERCLARKCMVPIRNGSRHAGLGVELSARRTRGGELPISIEHGGAQEGYSAYFVAALKEKRGIVILSNGSCSWDHKKRNGKTEKRGGCALRSELLSAYAATLAR